MSMPEKASSTQSAVWLRAGAQVIGWPLVLLGILGWVEASRFVGGALDRMNRGGAERFALALTAAALAVYGITASVGGCVIAAGLRGLLRILVAWASGALLLFHLCVLYFALTMRF
ncbi:hypothetical protein [Saccharopolyspora sp. ASAGF58]|uniref:hypothetical protein n=1 Tax=Saccharopolyspora sp. ASAGF58 TaxID=2719023 RepID=UPI00144005DC|nr:hypothetical protein [Saccharopolyspora sp. ASAGF58]QIZ34215.1 hypothetical protein FDZ84_05030 [Saccharopolyspora sp. ASAGF58]